MTITFTNVEKTLRQKILRQKLRRTLVLDKVSAEFASDRITGILAPPGAGKSTVAALITGKLKPDAGRVRRQSLVSFPVASGSVFNASLTARENLAFLCRVFGFDPVPIIRFVVEFTELGKLIDKPMRNLDKDDRTKLLFTSSYAIPFETFIVDDALIGGRASFREQCETLAVERMRSSGFIILTSSPTILKRHCDTFFVLDRLAIRPVASAQDAIDMVGKDRLREGAGELEAIDDTPDDTSPFMI